MRRHSPEDKITMNKSREISYWNVQEIHRIRSQYFTDISCLFFLKLCFVLPDYFSLITQLFHPLFQILRSLLDIEPAKHRLKYSVTKIN